MPIPDFIVELRRHVGTAPLWLIGTTAVVLRERPDPADGASPPGGPGATPPLDVLLVRRADTGAWSPVTGIVDPGENPHETAVREVWEEARVRARVESLVWVCASGLAVHVNGDQARYLDHCFRCRYVEGEPEVGDDENTQARWWPVDDLPPMPPVFAERIAVALDDPARPVLGPLPGAQ